jgi:hypothetical protein
VTPPQLRLGGGPFKRSPAEAIGTVLNVVELHGMRRLDNALSRAAAHALAPANACASQPSALSIVKWRTCQIDSCAELPYCSTWRRLCILSARQCAASTS